MRTDASAIAMEDVEEVKAVDTTSQTPTRLYSTVQYSTHDIAPTVEKNAVCRTLCDTMMSYLTPLHHTRSAFLTLQYLWEKILWHIRFLCVL